MLRFLFILGLVSLFNTQAIAKPRVYDIDYGSSEIEFFYEFNDEKVKGQFPKFSGDLVLDFQNVTNSKINVSIDASAAKGGFIFATTALRGPKVLNVRDFPIIVFNSQDTRMENGTARINGQITVRGVTRPLSLTARFFQLQGQEPSNRENLIVQISGKINRHDFGASGYPDMVGDMLAINISAHIKRR